MLVLSRKALQSVVIGQDVKITVVRVEGNQVRIGIEAPGDVRILRGELVDESDEMPSRSGAFLELASAAS